MDGLRKHFLACSRFSGQQYDYITKGDDNNKIIPLISRAVEKAAMNARLEKLEKKVGHVLF